MTLYPKLITDALATVIYPGNKKNLVENEMVADNIRIDLVEMPCQTGHLGLKL